MGSIVAACAELDRGHRARGGRPCRSWWSVLFVRRALPFCARPRGQMVVLFAAAAPRLSRLARGMARARAASHRSPRSRAPPVAPRQLPPSHSIPTRPWCELARGHVQYGEQMVFEEPRSSQSQPGQHTLIEGPNGSGKSSLLEMITGDHPQAYANDLHLFGRRRGKRRERSGTSRRTSASSSSARASRLQGRR